MVKHLILVRNQIQNLLMHLFVRATSQTKRTYLDWQAVAVLAFAITTAITSEVFFLLHCYCFGTRSDSWVCELSSISFFLALL